MCLVMQVYDSLVVENNSEVGQMALVPSSFQSKKQTHSLERGLLGEDWVISPIRELGGRQYDSRNDQLHKSLEYFWDTSSWYLSPSLVP